MGAHRHIVLHHITLELVSGCAGRRWPGDLAVDPLPPFDGWGWLSRCSPGYRSSRKSSTLRRFSTAGFRFCIDHHAVGGRRGAGRNQLVLTLD